MIAILSHIAITLVVGAHILLRRHREPETRAAWLLVLVALPWAGALAYLLVGQTSIGRARARRMKQVFADLPRQPDPDPFTGDAHDERERSLFRIGQSISGYTPAAGNSARLMADSDSTIAEMIADIDAARDHVHILFYIWLDDNNGTRMAEAVMRAAARGVACRVMVDTIGSRRFAQGPLWRRMGEAGVQTRVALPVGNPLMRMLNGRIDLRNHRKILVVDNAITYCGSQNCADPAFLPKAKYGPWVDAVLRFTGPVVRQNQHLFASDWMGGGGDDITAILRQPAPPPAPGFIAQVVATGPTFRAAAMPEMFCSLIFSAETSLFITTPYYVPTQSVQAAICAAAGRGVDVTIIFPARNDDFAVGAACRSHYESLLEAGVKVHEFLPGLLHTKSVTLDGRLTLIGSANMDRRSFDLNYENNILLTDAETTATVRARQAQYLAQSRPVLLDDVRAWGPVRRIANNALAILGPVL
ncbi:cardiolipin synthase [Gemmobacter sp.]|uniref:cardiolipin synthase n=1 Tax=Gemmobacter sp. TaxID=1898957 RepID=UPI002AFF1D74|nr:cardiolipin synthase [Gemmobacter sp.]